MVSVFRTVMDMTEAALAERTPAQVGRIFFDQVRRLGIRALYAREHQVMGEPSRPVHDYARIAPSCYDAMYADSRFSEHNVIPKALARSVLPVRWSSLAWRSREEKWVEAALRDNGSPDGIAVPCHGPGGYLGVMSVAFDRQGEMSPAMEQALTVAVIALHGRMVALHHPRRPSMLAALTQRERDCLAFVAEGRTTREIAERTGLSPTTVTTHIVNLRAKLGARSRAKAVAAFVAEAG